MSDIVWYLHHHGRGHVQRYQQIAQHLGSSVTTVGSMDPPLTDGSHIRLPRDDRDGRLDAEARGRLHFAPIHSDGFRSRHQTLAAFVGRSRPQAAVVDVSVEVALFLRLMGLPVVLFRQPGSRSDPPHRLAYDMAEVLIAPWPRCWDTDEMAAKTLHLGLPTTLPQEDPTGSVRSGVLVVVGGGGSRLDRSVIEAMADGSPHRQFSIAGIEGDDRENLAYLGMVDDVAQRMKQAEVVVGNAGLNTLAEVAGAGSPFVCVPEERPFGEQQASASAIRSHAVVIDGRLETQDWETKIDAACRLGPAAMARLASRDGWQVAARRIDDLVDTSRRLDH